MSRKKQQERWDGEHSLPDNVKDEENKDVDTRDKKIERYIEDDAFGSYYGNYVIEDNNEV